MNDFFRYTIPGCYKLAIVKNMLEHWYDCTLLGLAAKQKENMCACMEGHCGIGFCALYCLEYEVSADHTSDL